MHFVSYVKGVAMQDGKVARKVFPDYTIDIHPNGSTQPLDSNSGPYSARHIPRWEQCRDGYSRVNVAEAAPRGESLISAVKICTGLGRCPKAFDHRFPPFGGLQVLRTLVATGVQREQPINFSREI